MTKRTLSSIFQFFFRTHARHRAAALSYFLTLTIFPFLLSLSLLLGAFHKNAAALFQMAGNLLPSEMVDLMVLFLNGTKNGSLDLFLLALFSTLSCASGAVRVILSYGDEIFHTPRRHSVIEIVSSVLFSLLLLSCVYLSAAILLSGPWLLKTISSFSMLSFFSQVGPVFSLFAGRWRWLRFLFLFFLAFVLFSLLFFLLTRRTSVSKRAIWEGSIVTAGGILLCSFLFSFSLSFTTRYTLIYGFLASIIILQVWIYLSSNILFFGVCFLHIRSEFLQKLSP